MRHPHTTDDIPSKTLAARRSSWRLPLTLGSPQRPSIRAGCYEPVTLYCMRPQAIRGSLEGAHPSDTRFPRGIPGTVYGGSDQVDAFKNARVFSGYHVLP